MDALVLVALLELAAQTPVVETPPAAAPVAQKFMVMGFTPLEAVLMGVITSLVATIGVVWKWGNGIRKENAEKFDELSKAQQQFLVGNAADNKDIVHALQDVGKTMDNVAARLERIERGRNGGS